KATIETYKKSAEISKKINANILTIHPGTANYLIKSIYKYNQEKLINGIDEILDYTKNFNVKICIENMPKMVNFFFTIEDIDSFFKKINRNIFMTWDTSHSWTCDINVELLWKSFYKFIRNIHLVDNNDKETDLHPTLGVGAINFEKIINVVKNYNYKGALIAELSSAKGLLQSIEHIKKFL
ncbi:MAG TPA: sugar phosphate isomerase/epimerase family protein, partial [Candidatus Lokiarchaeia archaeon]